MKRVFFFAVLASVAFAGCTFDEGVSDGAVNGNEINFAVAQYTPQTRAEHGTGAAFNQNITIWSWYNGANTPVIPGDVYQPSTTEFTSKNKYYWPADGKALDFVSVPTDMVQYLDGVPTRTDAGVTTLTFSIEDTDDYHADNLMTTEVITNQTSSAGDVALLFRHLLSKINIKVSQKVRDNADASWLVTVNDIKVEGLKNTGKVVIDNSWDAEGGDALADKLWDNTNGSETWQVTSTPQTLYDGTTPKPYVSAETYYMLPQTLEEDVQTITIDYTIVTDYLGNPTQPNSTATYSKTFDLKDVTAITKWAMNKNITYNIFIDPSSTLNPITFTVNEEEWGTVGSGDVPMP